MKQFALLMMLLFSTLTFAQSDDTVESDEEVVQQTEQQVTTAERVIDKYSGKAYEAVKELASALKVPAEHVYTILVKQAVVISITWLVVGILSIILLIFGVRWTVDANNWNTNTYGSSEPVTKAIIGMVSMVLAVCILIGFFVNMQAMIGGFVNPEYYAIKEILDSIR